MQPIVTQVDPDRPNFVPWWRTRVADSDVALLMQAISEERFSIGRGTAEFEAELAAGIGVPYAVATTSGSTALMLAMLALGIGPGDEVIVPDRTFIATAHAATLLGAKAVLVDSLANDPNVDPAEIARKINGRTKAIMVVHLNGRACDMQAIGEIARKHGVPVVEDAAQAVFSRHEGGFLGTFGALGCFSFGMTKLISTGQGGAIVTRDKALSDRLRALRNHGVRDVVSHEYLGPGGNFKYTDMQAGLGLGQIRRWREKAAHCTAAYRAYRDGLADASAVRVLDVRTDEGEVPLWTEVVVDGRDALAEALASEGIQTRKFLPCLHSAPHLSSNEAFPNSMHFFERGLVLPSGPDQPMANIERTVEAVRRWSRAHHVERKRN